MLNASTLENALSVTLFMCSNSSVTVKFLSNASARIIPRCLGVAYCFGKYEYWPIDPIKDEIGILFKKIIPGGKFYFTYNNCDFFRSLELCNGVRAYQTEELISNLLYSVGFNKVENVVFNDGVWNIMIVQKPGHLSSIKLNTPSVDMVKVIDSQSN